MLPQHADQHSAEHPILLAVDQELGARPLAPRAARALRATSDPV
jgi:hypothetical protein